MAYTSNTSRVLLLIAALVVVIGLIEYGPTTAEARGCLPPNFVELVTKCGPYVRKLKPIKGKPAKPCCDFLKRLNIRCACKFVTKQMESIVSPAKAIAIARTCGAHVKPGTKCGSYTVPHF